MPDRRKLIIAALVILLVSCGVVFLIFARKKSPPSALPSVPSSDSRDAPTFATTTVPELTSAEADLLDKQINDVYTVDQDFDGILDVDEARFGTSATSSDSDDDGLLDNDEVKLYGTNPTQPDTDADTYLDGYEVSRGFNPKGPGLIAK